MCYLMPLPLQQRKSPQILPVRLPSSPVGLAYDPVEMQIYFTDTYGRIGRFAPNGSYPEIIRSGLGTPMGIAIDSASRNIYFAVESDNKIRVQSIDGPYVAILVDIDSPQSIVLDVSSG